MFVIVRHGNTFAIGEPPRRIGARTDLPLTEEGLAQGRALGVHFARLGWAFSRVLVSPLARTRQTARAILEQQAGAPAPKACHWLREIDHGPDEDRDEALAAWDERALPPPGWTVDAEARIAAWRALLADGEPGPTLLVTSNGAARFCFPAAPEIAPVSNLKLRTGAYGVIRRGADGALEVPVWDRRP
jgi:probable phosphoglycerate mutase